MGYEAGIDELRSRELIPPPWEPDPVRLTDRLQPIGELLDGTPEQAFACMWNGAFVLESLPAAPWCFLHPPQDLEKVPVTAVNRGRDADTVAAMAGAYHGEAALPHRWLDDREFAAELRDLADPLRPLAGVDGGQP